MVKLTAQGTLVLPYRRINELLKTVDTEENRFHLARYKVLEEEKPSHMRSSVESVDFEVTGNRILVKCEVVGTGFKDARKQSFDTIYAVISELMTLSLKDVDIENEDTLMSVKDIEILSAED